MTDSRWELTIVLLAASTAFWLASHLMTRLLG
jgi:hypothetical protein